MPITIGNAETFATKVDLDGNDPSSWLFGRFAFIINGELIGNFELGTSLRDVLFSLDEVLKFEGNRQSSRFDKMNSSEIFRQLDDCFFLGEIEREEAVEEQWGRLNLCLPVDVLNNWKIFLIGNKANDRLVFAKTNDTRPSEYLLGSGEVDTVLRSTRTYLDDLLVSRS